MKYVYLVNNIVAEVIPEYDEINFPGIPITERYSPSFLSNCIAVEESVDTPVNWLYNNQNNSFIEPCIIEN